MNNSPTEMVPARLDEQIKWYSRASRRNCRAFYLLKIITIVAAATIPVLAVLEGSSLVMAVLGAIIVADEGVQQLFQNQQHWIAYRAAAEDLKRERSLYTALAGPYRSAKNPTALLVERSEARIAAETGGWRQLHEDGGGGRPASGSEQGAVGS